MFVMIFRPEMPASPEKIAVGKNYDVINEYMLKNVWKLWWFWTRRKFFVYSNASRANFFTI